jgi:hypothetical protein
MDLSTERWEGRTPAEREALARQLAKQLPSGFTFQAIRPFRLGNQQHHVALYQKDNATFALIPGAVAALGYDAERPWEPNPDELASWQGSAEEYGIARTIREYVADVTLRVRQVQLPPLLVETAAGELGWEPIGVDEPEVQDILRELDALNLKQAVVSRGDIRTRVRRGPAGEVIAERSLARTHADLAAQLAAAGFRFPTSDEWEYACGGGAPTLFRWGDHAPCDRYPIGKPKRRGGGPLRTGTTIGSPMRSACRSPRTRTSTSWWPRSALPAAGTAATRCVVGRASSWAG